MLLPDGNIFFVLKFHEVINQSRSLYLNIVIGNIILLIHDDMSRKDVLNSCVNISSKRLRSVTSSVPRKSHAL